MSLKQSLHTLVVATKGRGFVDATGELQAWLASVDAHDGLLTIFIRHTSASLLVQENADPTVRSDFERFFARLVADGDPMFEHDDEGPDDMPAHVRSALTQTQLSIPVRGGRAQLGTWQAVYVWEHRHAPHRRELALHYLGT
ncbi:MAG: YjbQ family protein [Myxococcaceae bacterium]|nr:YjbQ family protein [Myxococcaceae bacterium]